LKKIWSYLPLFIKGVVKDQNLLSERRRPPSLRSSLKYILPNGATLPDLTILLRLEGENRFLNIPSKDRKKLRFS